MHQAAQALAGVSMGITIEDLCLLLLLNSRSFLKCSCVILSCVENVLKSRV